MVFIGTSLTEGYGLSDPAQAYPGRIQAIADSIGLPLRVVNSGLSGETSAGALGRIDWIASQPAEIFVLEIGANDGLRGLDPVELERNLGRIVDRIATAVPNAPILLLAMEAPPNLGRSYTEEFRGAYRAVGADPRVEAGPFLLEGVAGNRELNQSDGIHPTAQGHERMARTVWDALAPLVEELLTGAERGIAPDL